MKQPLITRTLLNSLAVCAYVAIVASIMTRAEKWFGQTDTVLTGIGFLLLFCVSAATVGSLVFGYPAILFLNGKKQEGVLAAVATIGWLVVELVLVFTVLIVTK